MRRAIEIKPHFPIYKRYFGDESTDSLAITPVAGRALWRIKSCLSKLHEPISDGLEQIFVGSNHSLTRSNHYK